MRPLHSSILLGALLCVPVLVYAQGDRAPSRLSLEVRTGYSFPTSKLGSAELDADFGFGANVRVRLQPHLMAYGGWEWRKFTSDELVASQTTDVEETGYDFGLHFEHPFRGDAVAGQGRASGAGYWLRAGGLWNHIELEDPDGDLITDTKHGLGYEVAAGLTFPIAERVALTPGVRFRSLSRDLTLGSRTQDVSLRYVTAGLGLVFSF